MGTLEPRSRHLSDHGGDWGFSIGNSPDDDLPARLDIMIQSMTQPLYRLLQKSDMFPRDSNCVAIIQQCFGDGYTDLKQIMFQSHPEFHPQPATLLNVRSDFGRIQIASNPSDPWA